MRITLQDLQVIADNEKGLQKEGFWYEEECDAWYHAFQIAGQVLSPANQNHNGLVTVIYNTIMANPCRAAFNAPPNAETLIAQARQREEAALEAWTNEQEERAEYERVIGR